MAKDTLALVGGFWTHFWFGQLFKENTEAQTPQPPFPNPNIESLSDQMVSLPLLKHLQEISLGSPFPHPPSQSCL